MGRLVEADRVAISTYLEAWDGVSSGVGTLEAGLRDARVTMAHGNALWLATLGYLVVAEQVGKFVARPNTSFPRGGSEACFLAGVREFAPRRVGPRAATGLYGLRCSLAHEYGTRNVPLSANKEARLFVLAQDGPLIKHARVKWDRTPTGARRATMRTRVNVRAVGDLVESIVDNLRREHAVGAVWIAPKRTAEELMLFARFRIG